MIIKTKTRQLIQQALKEDIGAGDITTCAIIPQKQDGKFVIFAKEPCIVCGIGLCEAVFQVLDEKVHFRPLVSDGTDIPKGKVAAHIEGNCHSILTAERTALNFLSWLSGISTLTNKFVIAVKDYKADIMDTRKTLPTLRSLQKYAVKIGGGKNHRQGLYDQMLIKDNHLAIVDSINTAIERARKYGPKGKSIEIEVKDLKEFTQALELDPDIIMLDNMKTADIKEAVNLRNLHRIKRQDIGFKSLLEASGNVTLDNVAEIAKTGIERISIGVLTHSAPAVDFSLKAE